MDDDQAIGFVLFLIAGVVFLAGVFWKVTLTLLGIRFIFDICSFFKSMKDEKKKDKTSREFLESIYGKDFRK